MGLQPIPVAAPPAVLAPDVSVRRRPPTAPKPACFPYIDRYIEMRVAWSPFIPRLRPRRALATCCARDPSAIMGWPTCRSRGSTSTCRHKELQAKGVCRVSSCLNERK